jgi:hypothetical protein
MKNASHNHDGPFGTKVWPTMNCTCDDPDGPHPSINCRKPKQPTLKEAFMAGYDEGTDDSGMGFSGTPKIEAAFVNWLDEQAWQYVKTEEQNKIPKLIFCKLCNDNPNIHCRHGLTGG